MTRLTKIAITTRKLIRLSILFTIFTIFLWITIPIVISALTPEPPPAPPKADYGLLPELPFPNVGTQPQFNYIIETPEGGLPKLAERGNVYFMPKSTVTLLSLDQSKNTAAIYGFNTQPTQISPTVYRFRHPIFPSTMEINIATKIFSISYKLEGFLVPLQNRPPPPEVAVNIARTLASNANQGAVDLLGGRATHELLRVEAEDLVPVSSLSEANLIKVNLFRKDYNDLPSLTTFPSQANVWMILSGTSGTNILAGEFFYFPVDEKQSSDYPLRSAENAFDVLQSGNAYIASIGNNEPGSSVVIRRVHLGYYDSGVTMDFYQPIVVFEGDKGFTAYVPAVIPELYDSSKSETSSH